MKFSFFAKSNFLIYISLLIGHSPIYCAARISMTEWNFKFVKDDSSLAYANCDLRDSGWSRVSIPHSYNADEGYKKHKSGFGWYISDLPIPAQRGNDLFLASEGVCLRCMIFIDGVLVGSSKNAYLPFRIDISPYVKKKKVVHVAIRVDNRLTNDDFPDRNCNGWWIYGGLIRGIFCEELEKKRIENIQIRTSFINAKSFQCSIRYDSGQIRPDSVVVQLCDAHGNELGLRYTMIGLECKFIAHGVLPWSPNSPVLYKWNFIPYWEGRKGGSICIKRGFSQLSAHGNSLQLNGKSIFMRGIGRHDVGENERGPLLTREERLADLVSIKSTGANSLRIAHFPQHQDIYEICDSIGLIVIDEMPAWKTRTTFLADSTTGGRRAKEYMAHMIRYHGNYTCIGIWCVGNELHSETNRVARYIESISEFVKKSDSTRLVTYTTYFYQFDKAYQYVDVASINEYFGWYLGSIDMIPTLLNSVHREVPEKPIIITEFGSVAQLGIRNPDTKLAGPVQSMVSKDFSEDYQSKFHKAQIGTIWNCRNICSGAFLWCYNDFKVDRVEPVPNREQRGMNGMGLMTTARQPKMAFQTVKDAFGKLKAEAVNKGGY